MQRSGKTQLNARQAILMALKEQPRTCEELGQIIGAVHQTASSAIAALRDAHEVIDSGQKRDTTKGRAAIVWRLTRANERSVAIKNGWRLWDSSKPPKNVPILIRDHQFVYHGETYMLNDDDQLTRVIEAKWHDGGWHCQGSLSALNQPPPHSWRPLPTV